MENPSTSSSRANSENAGSLILSVSNPRDIVQPEEEDDSSSWESFDEDESDHDPITKISNNSLVLEKVFAHLSFRDLKNCRRVNRRWNEVALLQANLGSKARVTVSIRNIERINRTAEKSWSPFCRRFNLDLLDLDAEETLSFSRNFNNFLTMLSFNKCKGTSSQALETLLTSLNLKELRIQGPLPEPPALNPLTNLTILELWSSGDYDRHVSGPFIRTLLDSSDSLRLVRIAHSYSLFKTFGQNAKNKNLKIRELELIELEQPLEIEDFEFLGRSDLRKFCVINSTVWRPFLVQLLESFGSNLEYLTVTGRQRDILGTSLGANLLPNLKHILFPLEGICREAGLLLLQSVPNLEDLTVFGHMEGKFFFQSQQLVEFWMNGRPEGKLFGPWQTSFSREKRMEFYKLLDICPSHPQKLRLNILGLTSPCLRSIYRRFPDLEHLEMLQSSRQCLDAWTGIPMRICRKLSACRSFAVVRPSKVQRYLSVASLKKLKSLAISISDEPPKPEFTLLYVLYGICQLSQLEELRLNNFSMSDIAFIALHRHLQLRTCYVNDSLEPWHQFLTTKTSKVGNFVLPPLTDSSLQDPLCISKVLHTIFKFLPSNEVYKARLVSKFWHKAANGYLHSKCSLDLNNLDADRYLNMENMGQTSAPNSPHKTPRKTLTIPGSNCFTQASRLLSSHPPITNLTVRGMNKSLLEVYQRKNKTKVGLSAPYKACEDRRKILYWFYPDGQDDLVIPDPDENPTPTSLILIGSWTKKDVGLLQFLEPSVISEITLHGLLQEVLDLILPKLTAMRSLETLAILPFSSSSITELTRNHLQILSNSSFSLRSLTMQKLQTPSETIVDFVKSHRYTLESLNLQNHVNISDRLSFNIPHLKKLQLDEPPGTLLWTTLLINQGVETIHFERSGYVFNQIKSKAMPKLDLVDKEKDFDHNATDILCDLNLFLDSSSGRRNCATGQRSSLQEGSDSALRFFSHFKFLTSLTLRSVHAHYGLLQGLFRNFTQLEHLVFTNTAGITDEVLTGLPKYLLDRIDLLNPLCFKDNEACVYNLGKNSHPSLRNMKRLKHLSIDDQTGCTDLSVIYGVMRLKRLEYFSCKKWKITDISLRILADNTNLKHMVTDDCKSVSRYGVQYFKDKSLNKLSS